MNAPVSPDVISQPFGRALVDLGREQDNVLVLVGDLGRWTDTAPFAQAFPFRYLQMGMSEQNMMGVAAGLARTGFVPFVVGYGVFCVRRCFDQLAMNVALDRRNVKVVGFLPGITARFTTHQAIEDLALVRALPNMVVIDPGDATELIQATRAIATHPGPVYMRGLQGQVPVVFDPHTFRFQIGKAVRLRVGNDVGIISTGLMTEPALKASDELGRQGIRAAVLHMGTLKPLDTHAVLEMAGSVRALVTAENHTIIGGLAGAVAETLARAGVGRPLEPVGISDSFPPGGPLSYLAERLGLTPAGIATAANRALSRAR